MTAKKTAQNGTNGSQPMPLAAFTAMNGDMSKAFAEMQATYAKRTEAMREELARFANDRLTGTAKTIETLAHCKNPLEMVGVQQQWLMGLSRDYLKESWKLVTLADGMVHEAIKPMGEALQNLSESRTEQ